MEASFTNTPTRVPTAIMQKRDGSQLVVYVNDALKVTNVAAFGGPDGPAPQGYSG